MSLLSLEQQLEQLNNKKAKLSKEYLKQLDTLQAKIDEVTTYRDGTMIGLDADRIIAAKKAFILKNLSKVVVNNSETTYVLDQIKKDLLNDCKTLRKNYFGCKKYDRFLNQSVVMSYGYGPAYGTVFWEIGLLPEYQNSDKKIPEDAIEGLLYIVNILLSDEAKSYKKYL